jgi:hypothetical protein
MKLNFGRFFLNCAHIFWAILFGKNAPNTKKYRPNGEISPNLVTLDMTESKIFVLHFKAVAPAP